MTDSIFDDFDGFLQPFLARPGTAQARGRLTASQIKDLAPSARESKLNQSAENAIVPVAYGETPVTGKLIGFVANGSPEYKYYLVMWCMGPIHSVDKLYINDSDDFSGITDLEIRHYLGTTYQGPDPWFESFVGSYTDDLVFTKPVGKVGVAYSAIKIATSWVDTNGTPSFQAIVKGRFCPDPDKSTYTDSYYDDVGLQVEFTGANGSTPTDLDESSHAHALTYVASADIQSNKLSLNGTDEAVTVAYDASFAPGSGPWCIEITAATSSIAAGVKTLFNRGVIASSRRSLTIGRSGADLTVVLSSDGSASDLMTATVTSAFVADTDVDIILVFTGQCYMLFVDGVIEAQSITSTPIFANTDLIELGKGSGFWGGTITKVRYTVGAYRIAAEVPSSEIQSPWFDSGRYQTGYIYSDNSALCAAEMIENPFYGQNSTVAGLKAAKDWCDTLLGGVVARGRLSLLITNPQQTQSYIDLLCSYAGLFNITDEAGYVLIPDRPPVKESPSGQQKVPLHTMQEDPSEYWTFEGAEWSYTSNSLRVDGTQTTGTGATYTLTGLVVGEKYAVKITITPEVASEGYFVTISGTQVAGATTATDSVPETRYGEFTATATSHVIRIGCSADFVGGFTLVSVRSFYWIETEIVKDSLRIKGVEDTSTPSKVSVKWREPQSDSANWPEKQASYTLPDAQTGAIPLVETVLPMPGVFRSEEAANKAESRALRLRGRNEYRWTSLDPGIALRMGTVAKLMLPELTQAVMLLKVGMGDYGRYSVSGETYSDTHYPDRLELPENTGLVPIGAVILLSTADVPDSYQVWSAADGKYLVTYDADNPAYDIGDTLGAATSPSWVGSTTSGGSHRGSTAGSDIPIQSLESATGTSSTQTKTTGEFGGAHPHTYSTGTITPIPYHRQNVLAERITTDGLKIPEGAMVFGLEGIEVAGLTRSTAWAGRIIKAGASNALGGQAQQFIAFTTDNATMPSHLHHFPFPATVDVGLSGPPVYTADELEAESHEHNHPVSLELVRNLRRVTLALYIASADASVVPGVIMVWKGALSGLANYPDWTVCDGRLGSPDIRRCYIEIAALGTGLTISGDNTISVNGNVQFDPGHDHLADGATLETETGSIEFVAHGLWKHNDHTISRSASWQPPSQAVALIIFNPVPDWGYVDLSLLLGGGEADAATTIVDSGPDALTADVSTGVEYDDAQAFFAATSIKTTAATACIDYDGIFANGINGRFTLGMWYRTSSLASNQWLLTTEKDITTEDYWELRITTSGHLEFMYNGSIEIQATSEVAADTDMFVAVTWDTEEFRLYSGTVASETISRIGTFSSSPVPDLSENLILLNKASKTKSLTGWVEDVYIIDGAAQFTEAVESIPDQPPRS